MQVTEDPSQFVPVPNQDGSISSILAVQGPGPDPADSTLHWFAVIGIGSYGEAASSSAFQRGSLHTENAQAAPAVLYVLEGMGLAASSEIVVPVMLAGTAAYFVWRYTIASDQAPTVAQSIDLGASQIIRSPVATAMAQEDALSRGFEQSLTNTDTRNCFAPQNRKPAASPPDGPPPCVPVSAIARSTLLTDLPTFWGTQVAYVCQYNEQALPTTACGEAGPGEANYCSGDRSISWDAGLVGQVASHWDYFAAASMILAHEWGHENQRDIGIYPPGPSISKELNADCQAGMFAAYEEARYKVPAGAIGNTYNLLCHIANPEDPSFMDDLYGTCEERATAFNDGYTGMSALLNMGCDATALDPISEIAGICGW